jgi:hypothetical protein
MLSCVFFDHYTKTNLEVPSEGFHEVAGLSAQNRFVAMVLAYLAVVDLFDFHIRERRVIEEPVVIYDSAHEE